MGIMGRNKSFLFTAALILVIGAVIFGGVTVVKVMADDGAAPVAAPAPASYNSVSSFGMTGYAPLTVQDTPETPGFVAKRLREERGMVLLVYVQGAGADMEMLRSFNAVKATYAADTSFFSFEARDVTETGNLLDQLKVSDPPVLAIIDGTGKVAELYTGWVDQKVLSQRIADAVRGY